MILPKKGETKADSVKTLTSGFNKAKINMEPIFNKENKQTGLKIDTKTFKQTQKFQCTAQVIFLFAHI